jgi:hypothetical protein
LFRRFLLGISYAWPSGNAVLPWPAHGLLVFPLARSDGILKKHRKRWNDSRNEPVLEQMTSSHSGATPWLSVRVQQQH